MDKKRQHSGEALVLSGLREHSHPDALEILPLEDFL